MQLSDIDFIHCMAIITYEHFKFAGANVFELLVMLFNDIVKYEQYPGLLKKGLAVPLFKGGEKDPLERNDFRGITIQSVICTVFDTIVFNRSVDTVKQHVDVCKTQAACEKALSSLDSSLLLHETIAHIFYTKKAFDTVWVDGLFTCCTVGALKVNCGDCYGHHTKNVCVPCYSMAD